VPTERRVEQLDGPSRGRDLLRELHLEASLDVIKEVDAPVSRVEHDDAGGPNDAHRLRDGVLPAGNGVKNVDDRRAIERVVGERHLVASPAISGNGCRPPLFATAFAIMASDRSMPTSRTPAAPSGNAVRPGPTPTSRQRPPSGRAERRISGTRSRPSAGSDRVSS
jgi:hypothetical protein